MGKKVIHKPTEEQAKFYEFIFDKEIFRMAIRDIEMALNEEKSMNSLMKFLQDKFGYDN